MKKSVILLNLGGPNKREEIKGFLYNLFSDKNIINLPFPLRQLVAFIITTLRKNKTTKLYDKIGGFSPILKNTKKQAESLKEHLGDQYDVFIAMRYSSPRIFEVIPILEKNNYKEIILLPLYPQYSNTTTKSSIEEYYKYASFELTKITKVIPPYYNDPLFLASLLELLEEKLKKHEKFLKDIIVLFSAHGLPKKVIDKGDPYQKHIEECVKKLKEMSVYKFESIICYQSKVGPLEWIKPYTEEVILEQAKLGKIIIVVPIAFVSEHIETLVELDIEYKKLAMENGAKDYIRVKTQGNNSIFIKSLTSLIKNSK